MHACSIAVVDVGIRHFVAFLLPSPVFHPVESSPAYDIDFGQHVSFFIFSFCMSPAIYASIWFFAGIFHHGAYEEWVFKTFTNARFLGPIAAWDYQLNLS